MSTNKNLVPLSLRAAALAMAFGSAQAQHEAALPEVKATAARERDNGVASAGAKFDTPVRDIHVAGLRLGARRSEARVM